MLITSYIDNNPAFSYEWLVNLALESAGIQNASISVRVFEEIDEGELLEAILCALNHAFNTSFNMEYPPDHLVIRNASTVVCYTFA